MELKETLASLKDQAHELTKAELADADGALERREKARALQAALREVTAEVGAAPEADRPTLDNLVQATERYLILFTIEDSPPEAEGTLLARVEDLHREVLDYARRMAHGATVADSHDRAVEDFRSQLDAMLAEPGARTPELDAVFGDADLDVEFVRHRGQAPSSIRLARESRA